MTDVMKMAVLAVLGAFFALLLKEEKPVFALAVGLLSAVMLLLFAVPYLSAFLSFASQLYNAAGGEDTCFRALCKVTGISLVCRIGSDICKDAGQQALSSALTVAGRTLCIFLCLPQVAKVYQLISTLIPTG